MKKLRLQHLSTWIFVALGLGVVLGLILGPQAKPLGELGKVIIQLIKAVATPLLFLSIVHSLVQHSISGRQGRRMLIAVSINGSAAIFLGLLFSNFFQPGKLLQFSSLAGNSNESLTKFAGQKIDFGKIFLDFVPKSFVEPFVENSIIQIVIVALLIGFALRHLSESKEKEEKRGSEHLIDILGHLLGAVQLIIGWIVWLVPLAVFGAVAKSVGEYGFEPLRGLIAYVLVGLGGLLAQIILVYHVWIKFFAKMSFKKFWSEAKVPVIYSAGANSSLATLPLTLKALNNLGVSKSASTLGACIGTNLNNDGIILYEAMAALFVAQASGIDLSLSQQFFVAICCITAGVGIAGIPEAGVISLSLVLTTVGLPVEILPLLLTVDWIIARARSVTNVLGDMVTSIILDTWDKKRG